MKKSINAIVINENDNVATVIEDINLGDVVVFEILGKTQEIIARENIPIYHKIAIKEVRVGEYVYKYGQKIGVATRDIQIGEHVHSHNLSSLREDLIK
ncbi:hydrolase, UxaA family [Carboxydothermus hydrogenoformans Z-2901]|uniref:Hydrolase, UxaA family n=2 Tax=Carboxydothermus hydrogenoformans TaxID=129958 RepID=Q3ACL1_CARHZ|nr:hydrolase, UxaA family [Carboxydothermus hydrogenoformans Z-2901]